MNAQDLEGCLVHRVPRAGSVSGMPTLGMAPAVTWCTHTRVPHMHQRRCARSLVAGGAAAVRAPRASSCPRRCAAVSAVQPSTRFARVGRVKPHLACGG